MYKYIRMNIISLQEYLVNSKTPLDDLALLTKKLNIKMRKETSLDENAPTSRVILTSIRNKADFNIELCRQCNGVIMEFPSWKVLAMPSPVLPIITPKIRNTADYDIFEIRDGTIVTLYHYGEKWCMGSANGYDISDYTWLGQGTYRELFDECGKKFLMPLKTNCCYTIGFRHHSIHPLLNDPNDMWLICAYDLDTGEFVNNDFPLREQLPLRTNPTIQQLLRRNSTALDEYNKSISNGGSPKIHYGYILRARTQIGAASNILLESTLLKRIRGLVYNIPASMHSDNKCLEYIILRAYLNYPCRTSFVHLFPQFNNRYIKYNNIMDKLLNKVVNSLRNSNIKAALIEAATTTDTNVSTIDKLALIFVKAIEADQSINVFDTNGTSIVNDYITDVKYLPIYYEMLVVNDQ